MTKDQICDELQKAIDAVRAGDDFSVAVRRASAPAPSADERAAAHNLEWREQGATGYVLRSAGPDGGPLAFVTLQDSQWRLALMLPNVRGYVTQLVDAKIAELNGRPPPRGGR